MTERIAQQSEGLDARAITLYALGVTVVTVAGVLLAHVILVWTAGEVRPPHAPAHVPERLGRLHASPIHQQRAPTLFPERASGLDDYGWVSREAGVARVPLDVAFDEYIERQMRARSGGQP